MGKSKSQQAMGPLLIDSAKKKRLKSHKRKRSRNPIQDVPTFSDTTPIHSKRGLTSDTKDNRLFTTFLKKPFSSDSRGEIKKKRKRDVEFEVSNVPIELHNETLPHIESSGVDCEDVGKSGNTKRKHRKSDSSSCHEVTRSCSKSEIGTDNERLSGKNSVSRGRKSSKSNLNETLVDGKSVQNANNNREEKSFQPQQLPLLSSRKSHYKIQKKHSGIDVHVQDSSAETHSKEIRCYKVEGGCVLHISRPDMVSLQGKAILAVLCGEVSVLGHKMTTVTPAVSLFSPTSHSLVTISYVKGHGETWSDHVKKVCKKHHLIKTDIENILADITPVSVMLLLKKLDSTCCDFVTKYFPFQSLFGKYSQDSFASPVGDVNQVLESVGAQVDLVKDCSVPVINVPEDFVTVGERWLKALNQQEIAPKMLSCGGKNAGKSTFNRYLINSTLERASCVCYLDCDVGQTEFNPPGSVALHVIDTPVIGPPFSHQQDPYFMCFFGLVSPSENPRQYITCVQRVYKEYECMDPKPPLIINTMGWNKGLGINLLVDTCHITQPGIIVQLESMNQANNFPAITHDFVHSSPGWIYNRDSRTDEGESPFQHELIIIDSPVVPSIESQLRFPARDHRDMSILGYFSCCLKPGQSLQEVQSYCIPWKNLALHTCHLAVPTSEILAAINASIVGLCVADLNKSRKKREHPDLPLQLENTPVCQCLGMGIVRGIDMAKQLIYLITPLELSALQRVNTLIRGAVNIPDQVLLRQKNEGSIPYVGTHLSMTGASSVRPRRYMPRRRREPTEGGIEFAE